MERLIAHIRRFFSKLDAIQAELSVRWRAHANRTTALILLFALTSATAAYVLVLQPPDDFPAGDIITIPAGESLGSIAKTLQSQGLIRSPLAFEALVLLFGHERHARAGD